MRKYEEEEDFDKIVLGTLHGSKSFEKAEDSQDHWVLNVDKAKAYEKSIMIKLVDKQRANMIGVNHQPSSIEQ